MHLGEHAHRTYYRRLKALHQTKNFISILSADEPQSKQDLTTNKTLSTSLGERR
jgi:hypothetical protein